MKYTEEEREARRRAAFAARGVDYDEYLAGIARRKAEAAERRKENIERAAYRPNHEDDVQFGCVPPDTVFDWAWPF